MIGTEDSLGNYYDRTFLKFMKELPHIPTLSKSPEEVKKEVIEEYVKWLNPKKKKKRKKKVKTCKHEWMFIKETPGFANEDKSLIGATYFYFYCIYCCKVIKVQA